MLGYERSTLAGIRHQRRSRVFSLKVQQPRFRFRHDEISGISAKSEQVCSKSRKTQKIISNRVPATSFNSIASSALPSSGIPRQRLDKQRPRAYIRVYAPLLMDLDSVIREFRS
jgi:hypothetical protein